VQLPVSTLLEGALTEIRVARGGDVLRPEDQRLVLLFLNEVLERLQGTGLYQRTILTGTLTPGLQPHTIGPTGTFVVPRRPVAISQMNLLYPSGMVSTTVYPRSKTWWMNQSLRTIQSAIPKDFWYNPVWPNGEIEYWPIPIMPYAVEIAVETEIAPVVATDTIDLPQGYSELLRLWTAKKAAPSFAREWSPLSEQALQQAMSDVFGRNISVNDISTLDGGVPGGEGGVYDYRTGQVR
jgi:hypothetical protein